ncbi:MAG: hypothetical protein PGN07_12425 [Aeromicrobium erythreum]
MSGGRGTITLRLPSFAWAPRLLRATGRGLRGLGSGRGLVVGAVLVAVLAATTGVVAWRAHQVESDRDARAAALESARTRVGAMLSYDYRTLDADLAVAAGNTTGPFRTRYRTLLTDVVGPNAEKRKVITQADVADAAVVSGDTDSARLLVFLTQRTRAGSATQPTSTRSRLVVDMGHTAKGWFVTGFKPA